MKTKDKTEETPAPLLIWQVAKTSEGENTLKIGGVRAGIGGQVRMTKRDADAMNEVLPGCLVFLGV